jgi:hypothetical protein
MIELFFAAAVIGIVMQYAAFIKVATQNHGRAT